MQKSECKKNIFAIAICLIMTALLLMGTSYLVQKQGIIRVFQNQQIQKGSVIRRNYAEIKQNEKRLKDFLGHLKYDQYVDDNDNIVGKKNPEYDLRREHSKSSDLDFGYYLYDQKDRYIIFDTLKGQYAVVSGNDYKHLKSTLESLEYKRW